MTRYMAFPLLALLLTVSGCDAPGEALIELPRQPSLDSPCLNVGVAEYNSEQLKRADFCTPEGERIMAVSISDRDAWDFRKRDSRIAFHPVADEPKPSVVIVKTPRNQYQFTLVR